MPDEIETVLRLVAEGHMSVEEAETIIDALEASRAATAGVAGTTGAGTPPPARAGSSPPAPARAIRIRVTERGRQVVNLRLPLSLADSAVAMVPGLSREHGERLRASISAGMRGPLIDIEDENGDGVLVAME
jgi:hypothetical protein